MRLNLFFIGVLLGFTAAAQSSDKNLVIPYLCDNGKYGISDRDGDRPAECIFDNLAKSDFEVTYGVIDSNIHFVTKDGFISDPVPNIIWTPFIKAKVYDKLTDQKRFFLHYHDGFTYIYDKILNNLNGPLTRPAAKKKSKLEYFKYTGAYIHNPQPFVFFRKGENQFVLSNTGATIELPSNRAKSYQIHDGLLYYRDQNGEKFKIFDSKLKTILKGDKIIFPSRKLLPYFTMLKNGKRFKLIVNSSSKEANIQNATVSLEEIPFSLQWISLGYSYHEDGTRKWLEDENGKLYYTLESDEKVNPTYNNIVSHKGGQKKFLIGDITSVLRQPHISAYRFGGRYLFRDENGYRILNGDGSLYSDEIYENVDKVHNDWLWVEYPDGRRAFFDKEMKIIFRTNEEIVNTTYIEDVYVYKEDTLYGLLDHLGDRITRPISTKSNFRTSFKDGWVKVHQGENVYLYNLETFHRTKGLSNNFKMSNKHFDENGEKLISSSTNRIDSVYFYRQDGSIYEAIHESEYKDFQKVKQRYIKVKSSSNKYIYIDQVLSDTLLICNDCESMDLLDFDNDNNVEFIVCSYRNRRIDLYSKDGKRLLPIGMSMKSNISTWKELSYYPRIIVQKDGKQGIFDVVDGSIVIPIEFDYVKRLQKDKLSLRSNGRNQITDLNGIPINVDLYLSTYDLKNGDIKAKLPRSGTHKKKVYRDKNDPNMDPCKGKIVDAPNFFYKILDIDGKSRFNKKFITYKYQTDDLINVSEWTGQDTIYYYMNIKGKKRKEISKGAIYEPFYKDILELKEGELSTFVDKKLKPKVNKKFYYIGKKITEKEDEFYYGWDGTYTYFYNHRFKEKIRVLGKYHLGEYEGLMMYLNDNKSHEIIFLNKNGTLFSNEDVQRFRRRHDNGVIAYKKNGRIVFFDLKNKIKFWD